MMPPGHHGCWHAVGGSGPAIAALARNRGSALATVAALIGGIGAFCGAIVNVLVFPNLAAAATADATPGAAAQFLVSTFNSGFGHGFEYAGRDGPAGGPDLAGSPPASQPAAIGVGQRTRVTVFKGVPASCPTASPAPRSFSLPGCSDVASILRRPGARREQVTLEQGDAFTFPANIEHTFHVPPRAGRAQVLWVISPALPDHGLDAPPPAGPHSEEPKELNR